MPQFQSQSPSPLRAALIAGLKQDYERLARELERLKPTGGVRFDVEALWVLDSLEGEPRLADLARPRLAACAGALFLDGRLIFERPSSALVAARRWRVSLDVLTQAIQAFRGDEREVIYALALVTASELSDIDAIRLLRPHVSRDELIVEVTANINRLSERQPPSDAALPAPAMAGA